MDITKIQTLIAQGKIVNAGDIDPDTSYLQVGVWQEGTRQKGAAGEAYPSYAIPISQIASQQVIDVLGTSLYSTSPAAGPNFNTGDGVYFGSQAGRDSNGYASICIGNAAGNNAPGNDNSIFMGNSAAFNSTFCFESIFLGLAAGTSANSAFRSNFIGSYAGQNADNAYNSTFIGVNAGRNASNGRASVYIGPFAGQDHPNGFEAVFIGNGAGAAGGFYGASFGCLKSLFVGAQCGEGAKTVTDSCAIGSSAMRGASTNDQCIAINVNSFEASSNNTRVTGIGTNSTRVCSGNTDSIGIGFNAFSASNNSNNVIGIGYQAAYNNDNVNNVIALGYNAALNNTLSGQYIISNSSLPSYVDRTTAQAAIVGGSAGSTYLYYNSTTGAIEGIRF
jgi:hypothetical protein